MGKNSLSDGFVITVTEPHTVSYPLHSHPEWEFLYYRRGTGILKTENDSFPFSPGAFIFVPPFLPHGSYSDDGFEDVCITLKGFHPVGGVAEVLFGNDDSGTLGKLCSAAAELFLSPDDNVRVISYNIAENVFRLSEIGFQGKKDDRPSRSIKNAIDSRYTYPDFDLAAVIRDSGYAPNYARDIFKHDYGESPLQYLATLRIRYACRLISHFGDSLSVSEIAYRSGFSDPLYFSRVFRKRMGTSPRDYRKTERMKSNG